MPGRLVYLMGASGVGKDSLLNGIRPSLDERFHIMKRWITRDDKISAENAFYISEEDFLDKKEQGGFALCWQAHGLYYGIDNELDDLLSQGKTVIVNGSRQYSPEVLQRYPNVLVINVIASLDVLRHRLQTRGRESQQQIEQRIKRNHEIDKTLYSRLQQQGADVKLLDNSGTLSETIQHFLQLIQS